jgi:hypothetical protein
MNLSTVSYFYIKLSFMKFLRSPYPLRFALLTFAALIFMISCNKEKSQSLSPQEEEQANVFSTESDAQSEIVFNDIFDDVMGANNDVGIAGTGIFGRMAPASGQGGTARMDTLPACTVVSVVHLSTTAFFPVKIIIDFGTGCLGNDGHTRKGKIITTYTNRLLYPGASASTVFDGFYIDSLHVEGTHVVTNTSGAGSTDPRQYTIDVDAKIIRPSGNYNEWHSHKEIIQSEGILTPGLPLDDAFKVTGHATGKVKRGDVVVLWHSEIIEPLIKRFICHWISKGRVRVTRENLASNSQWVGILDYGTGNCDNQATLTVNGNVHQITL